MSGDGCVYAVQTAPGRVKLGYTKDLSKRLQSIEGHAGEARLLEYLPGTLQDERNLHEYCREQRIVREFFRPEGPVKDFCEGRLPLDDLPPAAQSRARWTAKLAESEREERRMREVYHNCGQPWPADGRVVLIHLLALDPDTLCPVDHDITLAGIHAIDEAVAMSACGAAIITSYQLCAQQESAIDQLDAEMARGRVAAFERQDRAAHRSACPAHVLRSARWHYRQRNTGTPWRHPRHNPSPPCGIMEREVAPAMLNTSGGVATT